MSRLPISQEALLQLNDLLADSQSIYILRIAYSPKTYKSTYKVFVTSSNKDAAGRDMLLEITKLVASACVFKYNVNKYALITQASENEIVRLVEFFLSKAPGTYIAGKL